MNFKKIERLLSYIEICITKQAKVLEVIPDKKKVAVTCYYLFIGMNQSILWHILCIQEVTIW